MEFKSPQDVDLIFIVFSITTWMTLVDTNISVKGKQVQYFVLG